MYVPYLLNFLIVEGDPVRLHPLKNLYGDFLWCYDGAAR
jgi:hypothetical protein